MDGKFETLCHEEEGMKTSIEEDLADGYELTWLSKVTLRGCFLLSI